MKGCIHVNCGDGKGKTTAAVGQAVRAAAQGLEVLFVQFLKGPGSGELKLLGQIPKLRVLGLSEEPPFSFQMGEAQKAEVRALQDELLASAAYAAQSGETGLLVLDEALPAVKERLLDEEKLRAFLLSKPESLEVVLTGREAPAWLLDAADYVTRMAKVKHPFDRGAAARKGIEY